MWPRVKLTGGNLHTSHPHHRVALSSSSPPHSPPRFHLHPEDPHKPKSTLPKIIYFFGRPSKYCQHDVIPSIVADARWIRSFNKFSPFAHLSRGLFFYARVRSTSRAGPRSEVHHQRTAAPCARTLRLDLTCSVRRSHNSHSLIHIHHRPSHTPGIVTSWPDYCRVSSAQLPRHTYNRDIRAYTTTYITYVFALLPAALEM